MNDLIFQILDWDYYHEDDDDNDNDNDNKKCFCIRLFGKTKEQKTVYLKINNFQPYFYVELNSNWNMNILTKILDHIKKRINKDNVNGLIKYIIEEKYKFWGFTNYKKFKFARLTFSDYDSMRAYTRAFSYKQKIYGVSQNYIKFKVY